MRTSDQGIALIKAHEGLRLEAYPDPAHGWKVGTIGYGHTTAAGPPTVAKGMRITEAGAEQILRDDLRKFEGYVNSAVHVPLTQAQFDALVSWTFNLGPTNLRSSTLLSKLNALNYRGAADEFLRWDRAGGRVMAGLTKRRLAERALFLSEERPAPKPIVMPRPVDPEDPIPTIKPLPSDTPSVAVGVVLTIVAVIIAVLIASNGG